MISIDEAIKRADQKWHVQHSHTEDETAYLDREVLAKEVVRLRAELLIVERELRATQLTLEEADSEIRHLQTSESDYR